MSEESGNVALAIQALQNASAGNKLIIIGGIWGTLSFCGKWLEFPDTLILVMLGLASVVMLIGVIVAVYGRKKVEEKEMRLAELAQDRPKPELSRADFMMLFELEKAGTMMEHDVYSMELGDHDSLSEEEVRGRYKIMRMMRLIEGGHVSESAGELTAITGSGLTVVRKP